MSLCSHTNSSLLIDCVMSNSSPYKPYIVVLGIVIFCIVCLSLGFTLSEEK